jgi:putative aldouronate transport system substrate-binding protein
LQHFVTGGHLWSTALKKSTPERTKELLRIMNWLAAPFGSAEDQLLTFGLKDVDYILDDRGNPTLTPQGNNDANYVPWKYTAQHPFVFFSPDLPNYAKVMADTETLMMPSAVSDPTFGQISTTNFGKGFTLMQTLNSGLVDIVVGRRQIPEYDQLVKDWQTAGGEQIRKEYLESIAASG